MFIVYAKFSPQHNYIYNLVESIIQFHPDARIGIWDSYSENDDYLYDLQKMYNKERRVIEVHLNNGHYGCSALWEAYSLYPNEEFYYLFQDSMLVKQNLDYLKEKDFTTLMYFHYPQIFDSEEQKQWCKQQIELTDFTWTEDIVGCFGITFFCKRSVLTELKNRGLDKIMPNNKWQACGIERVYGLALQQIGIDLKENNVCGDFIRRNANSFKIVEKFMVNRQ